MKKILILANDVTTILQFRCELISAFVEDGNDVIVRVPKSERIVEIEALGAQVVITDVARRGKNPLKDIRTYRQYKQLLKDHIAKYAMPREIEFRTELPKTLVGKVAYRVLEEEALAGQQQA